jgi:hypothetical protein
VYYEHPEWFQPLFAELERRRLPLVRLDASRFQFDPTELGSAGAFPLFFNRMSPSAWKRGRGNAILFTLHFLAHLESIGAPIVNGLRAFGFETSKALQLSLLRRLGLPVPRTRVVNHPSVLPEAARRLEYPLVVKPNIGGSGAGIVRFDALEELEAAVGQGLIPPSLDGVLLLQEFHPPEDDAIVRVETLEGRYLYGIAVHTAGGTGYNLCPADLCFHVAGCPDGAAKAGLPVEAYRPPDHIREEVEQIAAAAALDVGGVEYLVSRRDGRRYYYDINALSNFVADPMRVLGFDPTVRLVDALERRAGAEGLVPRARELTLRPVRAAEIEPAARTK